MKIAFQTENVTLWHGDCRNVIPTLPPMPLVVTSPPYNLGGAPWPHWGHWKPGDSVGGKSKWKNGSDGSGGVTYGVHNDKMPWPEYVAWQHEVVSALWAMIPDDGAIFFNHKPRVVGGRLWMPTELIPSGVTLRQIVIWARPGGMNFNPTAFVPTHEWVMILAKDGWRLKSKGVSGMGDVWRIATEANEHPAPFPKELPAKAIEATDAATVFDPFCGSGSTLIAALEAGKRAVGCEIDERWVEVARRRLERWHAQGRLDFGTANTEAVGRGPAAGTRTHEPIVGGKL